MPRLLFITERFPPDIGGLARSADRIAEAICQLGIEVDILTWSRSVQPGNSQFSIASSQFPIPNSQFPIPHIYRLGKYRNWDTTMLHSLNLLDWLQQRHKYDAVWGHYIFPGGFLAVWFAELQGLPSTVSARGNDIDRGIFPPGDFARSQWTLERANLVTAVSADMARKIKVLSKRDDVAVLKNAVNLEIFSPVAETGENDKLRESLGIAQDEILLGFSGELREKKGQKFLLNALTSLRQKQPACLLIIGEVRQTREAVLQLYAAQYPEDARRIIVTGRLPEPADVAEHLRLCDLYLQPSLWEGMPNALLEALACGICCIASDAGGIPEIIESGKNGFILPRFQLHHLGEAAWECLQLTLGERRRIGMAGRDRLRSEFSLGAERARLQDVLHRLGIV